MVFQAKVKILEVFKGDVGDSEMISTYIDVKRDWEPSDGDKALVAVRRPEVGNELVYDFVPVNDGGNLLTAPGML